MKKQGAHESPIRSLQRHLQDDPTSTALAAGSEGKKKKEKRLLEERNEELKKKNTQTEVSMVENVGFLFLKIDVRQSGRYLCYARAWETSRWRRWKLFFFHKVSGFRGYARRTGNNSVSKITQNRNGVCDDNFLFERENSHVSRRRMKGTLYSSSPWRQSSVSIRSKVRCEERNLKQLLFNIVATINSFLNLQNV